MEGQPMVSYSAGSMNSLVHKFTKLKNPPLVIQGLKQDLAILLNDFFHKVAGRRDMNLQAETWMKIVRDLVFDIEDWVDQKPDMGGQQLETENEIKCFKARIEHARKLCQRYDLVVEEPTDLHDPFAVPNEATVDSLLLFEEKTGLVGVEDPTDELVKLLRGEHEKSLRVVSIVGMEGLGKTTLAKEIYAKLQFEEFECWAFVSVGKRPSMRDTLMEILRQLKLSEKEKVKPKPNPMCAKGAPQDLRTLVDELWKYLGTRRFFILVDGLWSIRAWKIINCALPDENRGSRVLTTTCLSNVAKFCSVRPTDIYHMKALDENMSRSLYLKTIPQKEWPVDSDKVTQNMLKMCGGMPLAIIVTDGLLATNAEKATEPKIQGRSVLSSVSVEQYSTSEGMLKILHMSYAALSLPLKSCLLYLSVFRDDYVVKKDRLIRLWIAERFIPGDEGSLWETGERYFNELVMRRLIQPLFNYDDHQAVGCTVHSVILDFIKSLSGKGNFVTVGGAHLSTNTVRRFSLDCYDDQDEDGDGTLASIAVHLCRVRSVTLLGDIERMDGRSALTVSGIVKGKPVLTSFKLIRVLDLEGTVSLGSQHLEGIGGLVLLKYLGVAKTDIDKLPKEIGKLEQLETLDLRHTKLSTLPTSIAKQKSLSHLLIDPTVKLPSAILKMQGLEEVSTIGVDSSIDPVVELLKNSERLRVLGVRLDGSHLSSDNNSVRSFLRQAKGLFDQVASSTELRSLCLDCIHGNLLGLLLESPPSDQVRRFELKISAPVLKETAENMGSLVTVTHIDIEIMQLDDQVVRVLGGLPNVVLLKLVSSGVIKSRSRDSIKSRCTVGVDHGFKCLTVFSFICRSGGTELEFTPGAMPKLQRLSLGFSAQITMSLYGNFSFGIQHLSSLTQVNATIHCKSATASEVKDAQNAITEQARNFCTEPTIEFSTIKQDLKLAAHKTNKTTLKVDGAEDETAKAEMTTSSKNWFCRCIPSIKNCLAS